MTIRIGDSILSTSAPIFSDISNRDLSNLTEQGEAKFDEKVNKSLNNLDDLGQAKFDEKANKSLNNLDEQGEKHFLNKQQITNCLLEVPQNIKLELNDGTLTLKAGSKVIVPNGFEEDGVTPKFDEVVVSQDVGTTNFWSDVRFVIYGPSIKVSSMPVSYSFSGATQPSIGQYAMWYDTANNLVKATSDNGTTWSIGYSLPICTAYGINGTTVTSIDQIFNGIGYIGSTVFVDKGVKGLIPNGRNEDGTLRNIEFVAEKLNTFSLQTEKDWVFFLSQYGGRYNCLPSYYTEGNVPPTATTENQIWYNIVENQFYYKGWNETSFRKVYLFKIGYYNSNTQELTPLQPFRAIDYSDKSEISGWAMPSSKYIDLTLGANGTTYTAPANGWFTLNKIATASGRRIGIRVNSLYQSNCYSSGSGQYLAVTIPVSKGDEVSVFWDAQGEVAMFRFIYAQGEQ